jgi:hypothetical protein
LVDHIEGVLQTIYTQGGGTFAPTYRPGIHLIGIAILLRSVLAQTKIPILISYPAYGNIEKGADMSVYHK